VRGWRARTLAAVVLVLVAAACGSSRSAETAPGSTAQAAPPTAPPASTTTHAASGPRVIVVVEENHSLDQVIGSPSAPFISRLARRGVLLTRYFAITHPSLPNYIAMVSGGTQGISSDCGGCNVDAPNLVDQLEDAGVSWKAYMQGLPAACSDAHGAGSYAKKHDPFMYFQSVRADPARCRKVVPFQQFAADLAGGRLPRFAFISPDLDHDMHGAGRGGDDRRLVATADAWLRDLYGRIAASPAWRQDTRLVVTWDEGAGGGRGQGCCNGLASGGNVATIVAGPRVRPARDATTYTHYALLRSIERLFGLRPLGHAADRSTPVIPALARQASP
jgi:phosphatidylinositol-3-phosphatase